MHGLGCDPDIPVGPPNENPQNPVDLNEDFTLHQSFPQPRGFACINEILETAHNSTIVFRCSGIQRSQERHPANVFTALEREDAPAVEREDLEDSQRDTGNEPGHYSEDTPGCQEMFNIAESELPNVFTSMEREDAPAADEREDLEDFVRDTESTNVASSQQIVLRSPRAVAVVAATYFGIEKIAYYNDEDPTLIVTTFGTFHRGRFIVFECFQEVYVLDCRIPSAFGYGDMTANYSCTGWFTSNSSSMTETLVTTVYLIPSNADPNTMHSPENNPGFYSEDNPGFNAEQNPGFNAEQNPGFYQEDNQSFYREDNPGFYQEDNPGFYQEDNPGFYQEDNPSFNTEHNQSFYREDNPGFYSEDYPGFDTEQNPGFYLEYNPGYYPEDNPSFYRENNPGFHTEGPQVFRTQDNPSFYAEDNAPAEDLEDFVRDTESTDVASSQQIVLRSPRAVAVVAATYFGIEKIAYYNDEDPTLIVITFGTFHRGRFIVFECFQEVYVLDCRIPSAFGYGDMTANYSCTGWFTSNSSSMTETLVTTVYLIPSNADPNTMHSPENNPDFYSEDNPGFYTEQNPGFYAEDNPGFCQEDNPGFYQEDNPGFYQEDNPGFYQEDTEHNQSFYREDNPSFNTEHNQSFYREDNPGFNSEDNPGFNSEDNPGFDTEQNPGFNSEDYPGFNLDYNSSFYAEQNLGQLRLQLSQ
ncbi:Hypothetical predicted protein [Xyrichtys novacula]|nr:Hypothetical predicted protein [Xyrichtys novacula]